MYSITFTAHNGVGADATQNFKLTVNQAPAITTNPANQTVTAGSNASFTAAANGSPAPTVQWQVSTDNGVTFNSVGGATSATLALTAVTAAQNGNKYQAVFTNTVGSATTTAATLGVVPPPAITSLTAGATTITAGNSTTLTAAFSGGTGSVNNGGGTVTSGTPVTVTPSATTTYTLTVTNAAGTSVTAQATVTVVAAPVITSFTPGAATITAGSPTTLTAVFSGGTGSVNNGVGVLTSGTGVNITPLISTTYTLTVTNAAGASVTANTTVTVVAAPVITSFTPGVATITAGSPTTLTAVFSGGMGSVDQSVGAVTSGTPVNISPSTTTVYTLTVTNAAGTSVTAQATVTVNQALAITSANSTTFTVGAPGTFTLTASGGITPFTWSWTAAMGSSLPPGLNISTNGNNTGSISGTPITAGSFSVVVTVTDSESPGAKAFATLNIVIAPPAVLLITSGNPTNGVAGAAYGSGGNGITLTATGGVKPYTWSWAAKSGSGSQTPPGLVISTNSNTNNGLIAGTPSSTGSFQVTVTVTDSTMATVSADYNITITVPSGCTRGPATLCGQFTFLAQGASGTSEAPVMIAGTFTADGNNHITAGILDFNSVSLTRTQVPITLGPPTAYQVGQDGRGTITLGTSTPINGNGTIQFTFALNSTGTFAFLFESDDVSTAGTGNHASGYMQVVDSTQFTAASISGGYALGLLGGTSSATRPRSSAIAAVSASGSGCGLTSNGNGVFINNGAGTPSTVTTSFTCGNGGLSTIDPSTGRGTVTIVLASAGSFSTQSLNFSFYVIDATKLIFISTDSAGLNLPILSGTMFKQLKTSFSTSDLACGFREANNIACIFGLSGESSAGSHVGAGRAVGTSLGSLTVTSDDNNGGVVTPTKTTANWTVSISSNGLGAIVPLPSANSSSAEFVLIDTDNAILAVADGSVQVGLIRRQTAFAPSSAPGSFILGTQLVGNGRVTNASGFVAVAPPATNAPINGRIDLEQTTGTPTEVPGAGFVASYTMSSPATGRGTGTTTSPSSGPSQFIIYNVGPKEIILLESDSTNKQPMLIDLIQ